MSAAAETIYWHACHTGDVPRGGAWLSEHERARLERMRFVKRRADWRAGRWAAKAALSRLLGVPADAVSVLAAPDGAPEAFVGGAPVGLSVSLSHRGRIALCAVARAGTRLGCDVEVIEPRSSAFLEDYLLPGERRAVASAIGGGEAVAARVWSGKESVLKALRAGLRRDTRSIEVSFPAPSEDGEAGWVRGHARCLATGAAFLLWSVVKGDHVLTLAADRPSPGPVPAIDCQKKVAKSPGQILRSALL